MSDGQPTLRWYQYSLWSLLVFATFVSVLCSIGVCTDWGVPVTILAGVAVCFIGYYPLSLRKHPTAGAAFAIAGFFVRLAGLGLVTWGLLRFVGWFLAARS